MDNKQLCNWLIDNSSGFYHMSAARVIASQDQRIKELEAKLQSYTANHSAWVEACEIAISQCVRSEAGYWKRQLLILENLPPSLPKEQDND